MERFFVAYIQSFAATFKTRQALLKENWCLRHQLLVAHRSLMRASLESARQAAILTPATPPNTLEHSKELRFLQLTKDCFCREESRFCATLVVVAALLLAFSAIRCYRSFSSGGGGADAWAELDSFSPPAVAQAVLRREAQALLAEYSDYSNDYLRTLDAWRRSRAAWLSQSNFHENFNELASFEATYGPKPVFAFEHWAKRLNQSRTALNHQDLSESLDRALLLLYEQNRHWPEFIDLFLDIARRSPANTDIADWAQAALTQSRVFGREDEVLTYLKFAARFGCPESVARLTPILERWNGSRQKAGSPVAGCQRSLPAA